jgi:hypothetical protein
MQSMAIVVVVKEEEENWRKRCIVVAHDVETTRDRDEPGP